MLGGSSLNLFCSSLPSSRPFRRRPGTRVLGRGRQGHLQVQTNPDRQVATKAGPGRFGSHLGQTTTQKLSQSLLLFQAGIRELRPRSPLPINRTVLGLLHLAAKLSHLGVLLGVNQQSPSRRFRTALGTERTGLAVARFGAIVLLGSPHQLLAALVRQRLAGEERLTRVQVCASACYTSVPSQRFVDEDSPGVSGRKRVAHGPAGRDGYANPPSPVPSRARAGEGCPSTDGRGVGRHSQGLRPGLQSSAPDGAGKQIAEPADFIGEPPLHSRR